ncbi:MAG: isochorismate synthase [Planctomycetota bacterium]
MRLNPGRYSGEAWAWAGAEGAALALGVASRLRWDLAPDGAAWDAACSAWLERLPEPPDARTAAAPWLWGGRGFFRAAPAAPWAGWPAAELRLPEHVLVRDGEGLFALSFVDAPLPEARPFATPCAATAETAPIPAREAWVAHAEAARQAILAGACRKLVPARARRFALPAGARYDLARVWDALAAGPGTRYCLTQGAQAFVGRTPERLVAVRGERLETVALAGTAPRDPDPARDRALGAELLASPKIQDEHQAVVAGIRQGLQAAGLDPAPAPAPRLKLLAEAQHVETPLSAPRAGRGLWALVAALHPTPALAGLPQDVAQPWLEAHEPWGRGWFGAPLGWVDRQGDGAAWVAIRGALLQRGEAWAYAGAGVVAGSDPAAEWDETELKLTPLTQALAEACVEEDL